MKDEPHVPFKDDWYSCDDKFDLRNDYYDHFSEVVRADADGRVRAGGYKVEEVWERALRSAVMGLDITPLEDEESEAGPAVDAGGDLVIS